MNHRSCLLKLLITVLHLTVNDATPARRLVIHILMEFRVNWFCFARLTDLVDPLTGLPAIFLLISLVV